MAIFSFGLFFISEAVRGDVLGYYDAGVEASEIEVDDILMQTLNRLLNIASHHMDIFPLGYL